MGLAHGEMVEVKPCPHGFGLFASRDIGEGSVVREFVGLVLVSRPSRTPEGRYALQTGEDEYWDGFPPGSPDYWSNFIDHSGDPNVVFVFDAEKTRAWLKTLRRVAMGEELFLNYRDYYGANPTF
jgi:SET domain